MRDLNLYILEKLKINKDTHVNRGFSRGEYFTSVSINIDHGILEIKVYKPFKVLQFKENSISYKTDKGDIVTQDIFLNSNEYYQMRINNFNAVFLSLDDGKNFVNEKININNNKNNKSLTKTLLLNIFDKYEKDNIEDLPLYHNNSNEELKEILKNIENIKKNDNS